MLIRKRRQPESTTNGTERIDYSKPIQGTKRYYSFCPECGWRGDSDELLFEITKLIKLRLEAAAKSAAKEDGGKSKPEIMKAIENAGIREFVSTRELRKKIAQDSGEFRLDDNRKKEILRCVGNALKDPVDQDKLTEADVEKVKKEVDKRLTENFGTIELKPHNENPDVTFEVVIDGVRLPWRRYCPKCKEEGQVSGWSGCYLK